MQITYSIPFSLSSEDRTKKFHDQYSFLEGEYADHKITSVAITSVQYMDLEFIFELTKVDQDQEYPDLLKNPFVVNQLHSLGISEKRDGVISDFQKLFEFMCTTSSAEITKPSEYEIKLYDLLQLGHFNKKDELINHFIQAMRQLDCFEIPYLANLITLYQSKNLQSVNLEAFEYRTVLNSLAKASFEEKFLFSLLIVEVQNAKKTLSLIGCIETLQELKKQLTVALDHSLLWMLNFFELPHIVLKKRSDITSDDFKVFVSQEEKQKLLEKSSLGEHENAVIDDLEGVIDFELKDISSADKQGIKKIRNQFFDLFFQWEQSVDTLLKNENFSDSVNILLKGHLLLSQVVALNELLAIDKKVHFERYINNKVKKFHPVNMVQKWNCQARQLLNDKGKVCHLAIQSFCVTYENRMKEFKVWKALNELVLSPEEGKIYCFSFEPLTFQDIAVMQHTPLVPLGMIDTQFVLHDDQYMDTAGMIVHDMVHEIFSIYSGYSSEYIVLEKMSLLYCESLLYRRVSDVCYYFLDESECRLLVDYIIFCLGHEVRRPFHQAFTHTKGVLSYLFTNIAIASQLNLEAFFEENPKLCEIVSNPKFVDYLSDQLLEVLKKVGLDGLDYSQSVVSNFVPMVSKSVYINLKLGEKDKKVAFIGACEALNNKYPKHVITSINFFEFKGAVILTLDASYFAIGTENLLCLERPEIKSRLKAYGIFL